MTKFISKYKHYKLVMIATRKDFVGGIPNIVYGKSIIFKDGEYNTDNKDEIDFMRNHTDFGNILFESDNKTLEEIVKEPEVKIEIGIEEIKPVIKIAVKRRVKAKSRAKPKIKTKVG